EVGEPVCPRVVLARDVRDRELSKSLGAQDRFGQQRLQVLRADLEVAAKLFDQEPAVGTDVDVVCTGLLGPLEREEQRAIFGDVVGRGPERLVELERGSVTLRLDEDSRARGPRIASRFAFYIDAEFHIASRSLHVPVQTPLPAVV